MAIGNCYGCGTMLTTNGGGRLPATCERIDCRRAWERDRKAAQRAHARAISGLRSIAQDLERFRVDLRDLQRFRRRLAETSPADLLHPVIQEASDQATH
jgi:hypothetical protein